MLELIPRDIAFVGLRDEHLPVGPRHLLLYGLELGIVDIACASVGESASVSRIVQNLKQTGVVDLASKDIALADAAPDAPRKQDLLAAQAAHNRTG